MLKTVLLKPEVIFIFAKKKKKITKIKTTQTQEHAAKFRGKENFKIHSKTSSENLIIRRLGFSHITQGDRMDHYQNALLKEKKPRNPFILLRVVNFVFQNVFQSHKNKAFSASFSQKKEKTNQYMLSNQKYMFSLLRKVKNKLF